jgi:hypothetical protein
VEGDGVSENEEDPYADLKRHRATPEMMAQLAVVPRQVRRKREQFIKVPGIWVEKLARTRYLATYRVALHVLYRHWKGRGEPFTLSNGMVEMEGVTRWGKWRALTELERLGLITVKRRHHRSPLITVIATG